MLDGKNKRIQRGNSRDKIKPRDLTKGLSTHHKERKT